MLAEQLLYFTVALCYNHFEEERSVTVMSVGENIAYFRKKLGLTQEMLSERIGVTAQAVSKWENGVTNPDISLLPQISEALGIGIGDLFDGSRERRAVGFGQLPDAAYDAVLSVFRRARCDFYGIDAVVTDARIREVRENISARGLRAVSVNESETGHGAVYLSDAFSYVDRGYGGCDSALLLDMRGAGNLLSAQRRGALSLLCRGGENKKQGCKKLAFLHPFMVYFDVKLAARRICNHLQLGQLPDSSSGEPQFTQKRGFCSSVGVAGVVVTGVATGAAAGAAAALF